MAYSFRKDGLLAVSNVTEQSLKDVLNIFHALSNSDMSKKTLEDIASAHKALLDKADELQAKFEDDCKVLDAKKTELTLQEQALEAKALKLAESIREHEAKKESLVNVAKALDSDKADHQTRVTELEDRLNAVIARENVVANKEQSLELLNTSLVNRAKELDGLKEHLAARAKELEDFKAHLEEKNRRIAEALGL